jgi:alpha-tubulin suppressor-like RCC1 family protein
VTPSSTTLVALGETVQLTPSASDASGNSISGKTFTWSTSDVNVATVSSSGLVTAVRTGSVTITANTDGVNGTATVDVSQVATQLAFTVLPAKMQTGISFTPAVEVEIQDALGSAVTGATNVVTVAIDNNPGGGSLSGTLTVDAADGVASFDDLSIDNAGIGYTLTATSDNLGSAASAALDIVEPTWVAVSAGGFSEGHTCGLTPDDVAYCWGRGSAGQLGNGSRNDPNLTPQLVVGGLTFQSISAALHNSTCGLTTSGLGYCWGNISPSLSSSPVAVTGGLTFQSISAGFAHRCGITTSADAYCWGSNAVGELGNGGTTSSSTPVAVSGGLKFQSISTGGGNSPESYTCALTTAGSAYCWGLNSAGQLGNGSTTNSSIPVAVSGGFTFQSLSAGGGGGGAVSTRGHTCGITTGGDAYCWGQNEFGQLGNGSTTASTTPVAVSGRLTFRAISAGRVHTCGITTTSAAYCWGDGMALGDGTFSDSDAPVAVSGGLAFTSISAGWRHSCGITTAGDAYCWGGHGQGGALGNGQGPGGGSSVPVRVSDPPP